jgi:hypothetical protein
MGVLLKGKNGAVSIDSLWTRGCIQEFQLFVTGRMIDRRAALCFAALPAQ